MDECLLLMAMEEISSEEMLEYLMIEEAAFRENIFVRSTRYPRLDIERLSNDDCRSLFRFEKKHLELLRQELRIPETIKSDRRYNVSGLEGLRIYLRRLAYPNRLRDLEKILGLSSPFLSSISKYVMNKIQNNFGNLLLDLENVVWLNESKMEEYSQAIANKGAPLKNCWGFIDGTARSICRPQVNQQLYYSGHKRQHCLKYQSVLCPDGIIVNLQGPYHGKRHDAGILRDSNLYAQLEKKAVYGTKKYALYGDPAYLVSELLLCPFSRRNPTPQQISFNKGMSTVRQAVEWGFGKVATQFAFLDFKKNQKLLLQELGKMYCSAVILSNCHSCLYGSQAGTYFNLQPPPLEVQLHL